MTSLKCCIVTIMTNYTNTCKWNHNDTIKTNEDFFKKYTSHFIERVVCERELRPNRTAIYWPPTLMAISVVSFSLSRAAQPEAQGLTPLGAGFLYHILSPTGLVSKLTDFLSSPSYIIVQPPTQYLSINGMCHFRRPCNGMFDRHQAEITVMQFTGHSLPVHQSDWTMGF